MKVKRVALGDVAPISQAKGIHADTVWLLNLDMIEQQTGKIIEYVYVPYAKIGSSTLQFDENNVLYSKLRPYLNKVVLPTKSGYATTELVPLRPDCTRLIREYLTYFLRSDPFVSYINSKSFGAKMPRVNPKDLLSTTIPLPSLNEQKRIVSIFDNIFIIINLHKQQLAKLDELVKSRFVEMFGAPEYNNKGWPIYKLGKLCNVGSSKRIYQNEQSSSGIPFWRIADLVSKIDTGYADSGIFISENLYNNLKNQGFVPNSGDILITSRGTLGICYTVAEDDCFYFQDGMINWLSNFNEMVMPGYIQYLFSMSCTKKQIYNMQSGTTVSYLSIAMLKQLDIMVPDKKLQNDFLEFVEQAEKTKAAIRQSLERLELLKNSLMQEFFA